MFGCCKFAMRTHYYQFYDSPPVLEQVQKDYPEVTALEERPTDKPKPHRKWAMLSPAGEAELCSCPCHVYDAPAIMC